MGVAITYTYADWIAVFPAFSGTVTQAAFDATLYPFAQQYCPTDGTGAPTTVQITTNLVGLMCAHIAQLLFGSATQPVSPLVGRVSNASEGSVSVAVEMPPPGNPTQGWLQQTQYGTMYWVATSPYRTARYIPGPRRNMNPWYIR